MFPSINAVVMLVLGFSLFIYVPLGLTLNLRRTRPGEVFLGIILCAISPFGQFYVAYRAWESFLGVLLFFLATRIILGDAMLGFVLTTLGSCTLMYYRLTYFKRPQEQ